MNQSGKLSFVIPCYRSANTVSHVVEEVLTTVNGKFDYEIILVNDGSPDNTLSVLVALSARDQRIKVVDLARNFGQQGAFMAGFQQVSGDLVVILDDDGQCPVAELPKLLEKIDQGWDVVFAKYPERKDRLLRRVASRINYWFAELLIGKPKGLAITSFCIMRRFVIDEVLKYPNPYPYLAGLLLKSTNKVINVQMNHRPRMSGESGYTVRKLAKLWLDGFTAFSIRPLRIASIFGLISTTVSFIFALYSIYLKVRYPEVPLGYTSLMTAILFMSGSMMLMLGLLGEYIGRIYISINRSPQYVIRGTVNIEGGAPILLHVAEKAPEAGIS